MRNAGRDQAGTELPVRFHLPELQGPAMTISRVSLVEVRVHDFIYTFINSDITDQFLTCLCSNDIDWCESRFPPFHRRAYRSEPEDLGPDS